MRQPYIRGLRDLKEKELPKLLIDLDLDQKLEIAKEGKEETMKEYLRKSIY